MSKNNRHHHHSHQQTETADSTHAQTERLAYRYWEERGQPHGAPEEDWYKAERELARQQEAATRL